LKKKKKKKKKKKMTGKSKCQQADCNLAKPILAVPSLRSHLLEMANIQVSMIRQVFYS
jgi:hypothetical protein